MKIICITGLDGTGKSTLIEGLQRKFPSSCVSAIWDLMNNTEKGIPFKSKREVDSYLCELTPDSRLLFLAHAMKYSVDRAIEIRHEVILIDSYYYKYFASELALGANKDMVTALQRVFPEPDSVIELILSVEESAKRKKAFSRYECGIDNEPGMKSFLEFQKKLNDIWPRFRSDKWYSVDAKLNIADVLDETLKHIL